MTQGHGNIVGQNLDLVRITRLEPDDRTTTHAQQLMDRDKRTTKLHRDIDADMIKRSLCHAADPCVDREICRHLLTKDYRAIG